MDVDSVNDPLSHGTSIEKSATESADGNLTLGPA